MNRVTIMGNLGKDVVLNKTTNGQAVAHFSVATNESWISNGQRMTHTEWHDVTIWGKPAENCAKYLHKGSTVLLEGRINTRTWKNEQKVDCYRKEIVASQVKFLDKKEQPSAPVQQAPSAHQDGALPESESPAVIIDGESCPF